MGFNKRKMEDRRRRAAEQEAAVRRALGPQIIEDSVKLIEAWNVRQVAHMPMLFSPTRFDEATPPCVCAPVRAGRVGRAHARKREIG